MDPQSMVVNDGSTIKIIIPVGDSRRSTLALELGNVIARTANGEIDLIHVLESGTNSASQFPDPASALRSLDLLAAPLAARFPVRTLVLHGDPAREIERFARYEQGNSMLIITHGGNPTATSDSLGTVTEQLLHHASVPAILLHDRGQKQRSQFRNFLLPLDGSKQAEQILPLAIPLARRTPRSRLMLIHIEPNETSPRQLESAYEYLDGTADRIRDQGVRVSWEARIGHPENEIIRTATTAGIDLILLSRQGYRADRLGQISPITRHVIQTSAVPVLIAPPTDR